MKLILVIILGLALSQCSRPGDYPITTQCQWVEDDHRSLNLSVGADRHHLRNDAVTAEDVAIRWADNHYHLLPEYEQRRDACMTSLFTGIANQHRVDIATVRQYSRERDVVFDVVVMLCFGFFYAIGAHYVCLWIMRRFTSDARGYWIMAAVLSGCVALVGVLLGNLASIVVEGVRLNSGHLSYRMARIPWREHWVMLFACGIIVFGFVAMFVYKRSHEAQII